MNILPNFVASLIGGVIIGAVLGSMLLFWGRIAGVSGILFGAFTAKRGEVAWRVAFLLGLVAGGVYWWAGRGDAFPLQFQSIWRVILAGFLVGAGTRLANGCTSGHGVCGNGRGSKRSLVATIVFMATAMLVVFLESKGVLS